MSDRYAWIAGSLRELAEDWYDGAPDASQQAKAWGRVLSLADDVERLTRERDEALENVRVHLQGERPELHRSLRKARAERDALAERVEALEGALRAIQAHKESCACITETHGVIDAALARAALSPAEADLGEPEEDAR